MPMSDVLDLVVKYGLGVVLSIAAVYALWKITSRTMVDAAKREERYASLVENHIGTLQSLLTSHDQRAMQAIAGMQEANRFQREEHAKILEGLSEVVVTLRQMQRVDR